jgi:putative transposase
MLPPSPDLYSRKIVGAEGHVSDDADHVVLLLRRRTTLVESTVVMNTQPVLHGDNGSTLWATTVLAMLWWLGVKPMYSRPRVSGDNAHCDSLFCTAKYGSEFQGKSFPSLEEARSVAADLARRYKVDHRYSGTRYVGPLQRLAGQDEAILAARHALYASTR